VEEEVVEVVDRLVILKRVVLIDRAQVNLEWVENE
jgi:hypothetical protein